MSLSFGQTNNSTEMIQREHIFRKLTIDKPEKSAALEVITEIFYKPLDIQTMEFIVQSYLMDIKQSPTKSSSDKRKILNEILLQLNASIVEFKGITNNINKINKTNTNLYLGQLKDYRTAIQYNLKLCKFHKELLYNLIENNQKITKPELSDFSKNLLTIINSEMKKPQLNYSIKSLSTIKSVINITPENIMPNDDKILLHQKCDEYSNYISDHKIFFEIGERKTSLSEYSKDLLIFINIILQNTDTNILIKNLTATKTMIEHCCETVICHKDKLTLCQICNDYLGCIAGHHNYLRVIKEIEQ
jgi:hypothetical protein